MILDPATAAVATGAPAHTIRRWVLDGRVVDHGDGQCLAVHIGYVAGPILSRRVRGSSP